MEKNIKLGQLSNDQDHPDIVTDWIVSLLPIGVALIFYVAFMSATNLDNSEVYITYGAGIAFIALEAYWIIYGFRKKHVGAVIMGLIGIAIILGLFYLGKSL